MSCCTGQVIPKWFQRLEAWPLLVTSQATSKSSRSSVGSCSSSQAGSSPLRDVMDRDLDRGIFYSVEVQEEKRNQLVNAKALLLWPNVQCFRWSPWRWRPRPQRETSRWSRRSDDSSFLPSFPPAFHSLPVCLAEGHTGTSGSKVEWTLMQQTGRQAPCRSSQWETASEGVASFHRRKTQPPVLYQ